MPYPLGGSASTVGINSVPIPGALAYFEVFDFTWNSTFLFPQDTDVDLEYAPIPGAFTANVDADHRWGGIGAVIYIPSFPQLDRDSTIYPHAF